MIVDTSAVLAILFDEPDARRFVEVLLSQRSRMSVGTYLEAAIVVDGNGDPVLSRRFDELLRHAEVDLTPVTLEHATLARQAYRDYGKGSGHAAGLNFGDCFAYALAQAYREPLLFKGADFVHTDIEPALPSGG